MGTRKQLKIDLIQPRHNYAPSHGPGHIYLPNALLSVASRLENAGIETIVHDENLNSAKISSNVVGINLIGSPYIPQAIGIIDRISKTNNNSRFVLGGAGVSGLSDCQFRRLFGSNTFNGNNDFDLIAAFDSSPLVLRIDPPSKTSLVDSYEKIPDSIMKQYLDREFCFYVSQGCKFACSFCAAHRTFRNLAGKVQKVSEVYRDHSILKKDLEYLVKRAKNLGLARLDFYVSNLDFFQSPQALFEFGEIVSDVKKSNPGFGIKFRALATVDSFLKARNQHFSLIERLVDSGLFCVGFGIDGMTPAVWKKVHKTTNTQDKCLTTIKTSKEDFGLIPEVLMVFGHEGVDTQETLDLAYDFTLDMVDRFNARPRPHVAKNIVPGNDGWTDPVNATTIELLLSDPKSFQTLDFTALPSWLTHPNPELREIATNCFLKICQIPGNITRYVKPITPDLTFDQVDSIRIFNEGRYDI